MRLVRKIWQRYLDLKLQHKLTLVLLLMVFIPGLITVGFTYNKLYSLVAADTIRKEQTSVAAVVPRINDVLDKITATSGALTELPLYRQLFFAPVNQPVREILNTKEGSKFYREIKNLLSSSPVSAVRFYLDIPEKDLLDDEMNPEIRSLFGTVRGRNSYWRGIFSGTHASELFCPPMYLGEAEKNTYAEEAYIRSTTFYYNGASYPAYIACYYPDSVFTDILNEQKGIEGSVSYIIDDRNSMVASTDDALTGIYLLEYDNIENSFMSSNSFVPFNILGNDVYAAYNSISKPRWFLVSVLPQGPMIHRAFVSIIKLILIYLALLILAFIIASLLSNSITRRISSVIEHMSSVREGPPAPIEEPAAHDEIGDLINTYNYMTERMNQLLEKQAKDAEDLRIAEFNSLQAQINPHFLYNTLDMINWMAVQGQTGEISSAVQRLSRFYRLTLSRKSTIGTIAEETEHVSIYIDLQNMRYHDSITFILDIPDELSDYPIPRLTLQPVIENAIQHGILEKESRTGTIVLTGWREKNDIILLVSDDGVGIPEEVLKTILSGTEKQSSQGNNIAVANTHRRLQLLYGKDYGLHYTSNVGAGTEVEIKIPGVGQGDVSH